MRKKRIFQICIICFLLLSLFPRSAEALQGLPNTASFGYGARLDMWGQDVFPALELAASLGLDWVGIDVDWARHWPSLDQTADFSSLDYVLQAARQKNLHVLISLTHAPAWALTQTGPEPGFTNALLQSILNVYPDVIQAVELFPGANSTPRWGTTPNPQAYLNMLQIVRQGCDTNGKAVYLVTTVEPLVITSSDGSIDDLEFLNQLYALGSTPYLPIIGIRYPVVMGSPMSEKSELYPLVLRHYEAVRNVMLNHQHSNGMIWISAFNWPTSGTPNPAEPLALPATPAQQAQWVNQAIQLMRAQLFIGAALFNSLNQSTQVQPSPTLLTTGGSIHPANVTISQFAGGSLNSTYWSPQTGSQSSQLPATQTQSASMNFFHYENKPRK